MKRLYYTIQTSVVSIAIATTSPVAFAQKPVLLQNCPDPWFEPIQAVQKGTQTLLAGALSCGDITPDEVAGFRCGQDVKLVGSLRSAARTLNDIGLDFFFQGMMDNSFSQANCRAKSFSKYESNPYSRDLLNSKTRDAFNSALGDIQDLLKLRSETEEHMQAVSRDPRYAGDRGSLTLLQEVRSSHRGEIEQINTALTKRLLSIPMGYDPDVAKALIVMAQKGSFDQNAFHLAMRDASKKYVDTDSYFRSKYIAEDKKQGRYCYGLDFMNMAGRTGNIDRWLATYPRVSPDDKTLYAKLDCRLKTFRDGKKRLDRAAAVASFAAMLIPAAAEVTAVTRLSAAAVSVARVAGSVSLVLQINHLRETCFQPEIVTSADKRRCDPETDFQNLITQRPLGECASTAALIVSGPLLSRLAQIRSARLAVAGPKAPITPESIESQGWNQFLKNRKWEAMPVARGIDAKWNTLPNKAKDHLDSARREFQTSKLMRVTEKNFDLKNGYTGDNFRSIPISKTIPTHMRAPHARAMELMSDNGRWAKYYEDLIGEAYARMIKSGDGQLIAMAKRGKVDAATFEKMMEERFARRGVRVVEIPAGDSVVSFDTFRAYLRKGVPLDRALGTNPHGEYPHLLQMDYMMDDMMRASNGQVKSPQEFLNYWGSEEGLNVWNDMFDQYAVFDSALRHSLRNTVTISDGPLKRVIERSPK